MTARSLPSAARRCDKLLDAIARAALSTTGDGVTALLRAKILADAVRNPAPAGAAVSLRDRCGLSAIGRTRPALVDRRQQTIPRCGSAA